MKHADMILARALVLALLLGAGLARAQSPTQVANGTAFASSLAPNSPSQIVNPAGVSGSTWSGQTAMPTSVPGGLAGFSKPNTDSSLLSAAKTGSLTGLGNQAMSDCANYVPGSDKYRNQDCAAVNFLNNQCFQPTHSQRAVLGNVGFPQANSANCAGTYGAGQSKFGYGDQVTANDPMFQGTLKLPETTKNQANVCSTNTVVTKPAQYEFNTCIVSADTTDNACSQGLSATITNTITGADMTQSCPQGGSLQGGTCVYQSTYPPTGNCPAGYTPVLMVGGGQGAYCTATSTLSGTPYCPAGWTPYNFPTYGYVCTPPAGAISYGDPCPLSYGGLPLQAELGLMCMYRPLQACPPGYSFDGNQCTMTTNVPINFTCPNGGTLQGQSCAVSSSTTATTTYSCPAGQTLNGSNCVKQTVTTTWLDGCTVYEQSAGVALPTPIN
jgi:hypothetical protein